MTRLFHRSLLAGLWLGLALPAIAQETAVTAAPIAPEAVLQVTDLVPGIGDAALPGMILVVHYTGWLHDAAAPDQRGKQFDSSRERGQPFSFPLGAGRVIKGWDQGVPGMRVGGVRRLVIPPSLAYGQRDIGNGLIPPHSTLMFDVELLAVETITLTPQTE
ncbi:MAG: FKBP-type peptidyl-prolyl cis-trans isomerase [Steroidobacteraceae bacterium]